MPPLSLCIKPQEAITNCCAQLHHTLSAVKRYFPASLVAPLPNSEQINHIYTKSTSNHIHHHYVPSVTLTHDLTILSPLDLWTDPARGTPLLARWTEKLARGPQEGRSDSPHKQVSWEWWVDNNNMRMNRLSYSF